MQYRTELDRREARVGGLKSRRLSYEATWREVAANISPYRERFDLAKTNRGERDDDAIVDSSARLALRDLKAGMASHMSSPSRVWYLYTLADRDLAEFGRVKWWLDAARETTARVMARSNVYQNLSTAYGDIGGFSTCAMSLTEDLERVVDSKTFLVGSYWTAVGHQGRSEVFYLERRMTVGTVVPEFGKRSRQTGAPDWSPFSAEIKKAWERGDYSLDVDVAWLVEPNEDWDPRRPEARYKRFKSCHWELGTGGLGQDYLRGPERGKYLRESGFDLFPIICGVWDGRVDDDYGVDCPGMLSVADVKQLQHGTLRLLQGIDLGLRPPLQGPPELVSQRFGLNPGDPPIPVKDGSPGLRPVYEVRPNLADHREQLAEVRERMGEAFYRRVWDIFDGDPVGGTPPTAAEVQARLQGRLEKLGPVTENATHRIHDPLHDNVFQYCLKQGLLPPIPEELKGLELEVQYVSSAAQALRAQGLGSIDRVINFVGGIAAVKPDIIDKVDLDQAVDEYAERSGAPARIIVPDEVVAQKRAAREQAMAAQQQAEMAGQLAKGAKDLSQAKTGEKNALTDVLKGLAAQRGKRGVA